jgi:hypothetical protein
MAAGDDSNQGAGIRMDSVENVANWDFVGEFKDLGHRLFKDRWEDRNLDPSKANDHFLVVGKNYPCCLTY